MAKEAPSDSKEVRRPKPPAQTEEESTETARDGTQTTTRERRPRSHAGEQDARHDLGTLPTAGSSREAPDPGDHQRPSTCSPPASTRAEPGTTAKLGRPPWKPPRRRTPPRGEEGRPPRPPPSETDGQGSKGIIGLNPVFLAQGSRINRRAKSRERRNLKLTRSEAYLSCSWWHL